jgi:anti-sigma factor RsiW
MKRHAACDRARLWASLAVDSEISELERALLREHTASCPSCRRYAAAIAEIAERVRQTPLHKPARTLWSRLERPRRTVGRWQLAASAAAVAASLLAGGLAGRLTSSGTHSDEPNGAIAANWMFYTAYRSAPETALVVRRSRSIPS